MTFPRHSASESSSGPCCVSALIFKKGPTLNVSYATKQAFSKETVTVGKALTYICIYEARVRDKRLISSVKISFSVLLTYGYDGYGSNSFLLLKFQFNTGLAQLIHFFCNFQRIIKRGLRGKFEDETNP